MMTNKGGNPHVSKGVSILDFRFWIWDWNFYLTTNPQSRGTLAYARVSAFNAKLEKEKLRNN